MVTKNDFHDAFIKMGRKEGWSYEGLNALYDYLEELNSGNELGYELDVIDLCCEYSETTLEEAKVDYDLEDMSDEEALDYLRNNKELVSEEPLILGCL